MRNIILSVIGTILAICSSLLGFFYSFGGGTRNVENIYGEVVSLYGDGIYYNDSIFKVAITKGTDIVVIIVGITLLFFLAFFRNKKYFSFVQTGLVSIILYATTCLIMGTTFNRLFLLYVFQFAFLFYAFIFSLTDLLKQKSFQNDFYEKKLIGIAVFLIISGLSVLQWLAYIIPTALTGQPFYFIHTYHTEPTFVIDLAIILPIALYCGVLLLKRKVVGYQLAPVLLILLSGVGLCVIGQTIVQSYLGIVISVGEVIGLVSVFIVLGIISILLNCRMLKNLK